ncbi:hypothetical protein D1007_55165 [Hordeum vulgare]|uniref:DUF7812 domain-containing protein n=1 Tax=Hordeum vulgare subsp. vulgare TaxID=112509 RepID=A0A8I7B1J2_HORVV|nr:uncharacterized protein LOC123448677 isoform X1 [Hordeum vulgare subsp. vulgare]KAE8772795.1 hypothetical protein D1007_55165 [Hordeum vulgare]
MRTADELGTRQLALVAFAKLSEYEPTASSSLPSAPTADVPPLLSCCFQLLRRLDHTDPDLAARCATRLRAFIHSIISRDPDVSLAPALEVCLHNFVDISQLRNCTMLEDARQEGPCKYEHLVRLEFMSHHFISSVQDEADFEQFFSAVSWSEKATQRTPELGLAAAISLVRKSYLFSMPVIAQAHFVLLASRCVGNGDLGLHLQVFENAMHAYLIYLPELGVFDRTNVVKSLFGRFATMRLHNSCIQDGTNQKLHCQINRLFLFCKAHCDDSLHVKERSPFDIFLSFIEENQHIFPEQSRQDAVIIVKKIVSNILGCANQKDTDESDTKVSEEMIYLAAVLRLMSSSFLEVLHFIRKMRVAGDRLHENHIFLRISKTISLLGQYEANGLNIDDLFGMTEKSVDKENASVLMLFHFASLLALCLRMRFGFLWKACIVMIMMAMNLVIDEDKSLSTFQFLIASKESAISSIDQEASAISSIDQEASAISSIDQEASAISSIDQEATLKGSARRKSSTSIALQFTNLHKRCIQDDAVSDCAEGSRSKTVDGKAFLESYLGKNKSSEWDDLVDYVECEDGVDYTSWLVKHGKFKEFKYAKWMQSKQPSADKSEKKREYGASKSKRLKKASR